MALAIQQKAQLAVGAHSGRRFDELTRLLLDCFAFEESEYHVRLVLVALIITSKTNGEADLEAAISFWLHPDLEDMYLCPLVSVCEWIVAMSKMESLQRWLRTNDWRQLSLFTPLDSAHSKFCWGSSASTEFLTATLSRGARLANVLPNPAPRVTQPVNLFGPGVDRINSLRRPPSGIVGLLSPTLPGKAAAASASAGAKRARTSASKVDKTDKTDTVTILQSAGRFSSGNRRGRPSSVSCSCLHCFEQTNRSLPCMQSLDPCVSPVRDLSEASPSVAEAFTSECVKMKTL